MTLRADSPLMWPISARTGVVARFVIPGQARFILHHKDRTRKRFFDAELRALPKPVGYEPEDNLR